MYRIHKGAKGLTLVELILTMMLTAIILAAIWAVYSIGFTAYNSQYVRSGVKAETGWALTRITNELHLAKSITQAAAAGLTFTADLDGNGANETVQYAWSGVSGAPFNRIRTVPSPTVTAQLIRSVTSLTLSYYGANNAALSFPVTPSQVRLVTIDVTANDGGETFRLRTNIHLRNI